MSNSPGHRIQSRSVSRNGRTSCPCAGSARPGSVRRSPVRRSPGCGSSPRRCPAATAPAGSPRTPTGAAAGCSPAATASHRAGEPITTSELATRLGSSEPQVSRTLRTLRDAGLVRSTRDGKLVRHRLATDVVQRLGQDVLATVSR
ncbi:hypothetical protein SSOG_05140 [Streptomyces himastatinicus ATCC 53653]|uniref:HTH arsR-type domain-containing protein n=1 Tax=Streptomyces himastatinicus ATCC 53653 TaxID=457427 RepID=D9WGN8_9ACTN|nr:helix-turn-helix domain-containing protein [Streptomyces himastatinicus]EFL25426.1 hypothetical protein SSOG_05140 [Streptomyces himastatinicus ATCC 53653]